MVSPEFENLQSYTWEQHEALPASYGKRVVGPSGGGRFLRPDARHLVKPRVIRTP